MVIGVLLDWDGTLVDNKEVIFLSYLTVLEKLALPKISFKQFCKLYESDYRKFEEKVGIKTRKEHKIAGKIWIEVYEKLSEKIALFSGAKEFVLKLKNNGYKTAIVTAGTIGRLKKELEKYSLFNIFDVLVTYEDAPKLKPNPLPLKIALQKLKLKPSGCVYVGDMKGDLLAAKKARIKSIGVSWGYHGMTLQNFNPEYGIVNNFDELYKKIRSLK